MTTRKPNDEAPPSPADEIAAAAAGAEEAPDMAREDDDWPGPGEAFDVAELRDDCPITPLGFLKQRFYFLDFAGQLIELGSEFRKGELMALFGTKMKWLEGQWPQWRRHPEKAVTEDGEPVFIKDGFSQKFAQEGLIMACSKRRLFDPKKRVRGRGAHRGDHGELVLHCGSSVIVGGRKGVRGRSRGAGTFKTGEVGGYIYPTLEALNPPADEAAKKDIGRRILDLLRTWNWKGGEGAARLMLCWIAAALLGGALRIRPHGWIVGKSGAGKTTLQEFLRELMGDWGVFTEDATEAGVRQLLDQDTLAVMFDEIEAEEDNRETVMKIVRLARLAYSGASSVRGSADHQAKQFIARSCFLFSSIHHHEMPAQDRNRIAILQLSEFPPNTPKFVLPPVLGEWGDQLRRRLVEQWPRFDATLAMFQHEMLQQGYSGREQDTYGTLLACGDLLLNDDAPDAIGREGEVAGQVRQLGSLVDAARSEAEGSTERCIKHLASHRLPSKGSEAQETVGRWVQKLIIKVAEQDGDAAKPIRQKLGSHGLRVVHLERDHELTKDGKPGGQGGLVDAYIIEQAGGKRVPMWLAIANKTNVGVQEIFAGSMWKMGVWTQALKDAPGAWVNKKSRFAGGPAEGCVLVPLEAMVDVDAAIGEAEVGPPIAPDPR